MGFWGGLFGGQNKGLNQGINQASGISGFATSLGESGLTRSNKFWSNILSDNSAKIAKALAAPISTQQKQVQQGEKTAAEFHNRGGGVNSATQSAQGEARGNIVNLVGNLQSSAASNLAATGGSLLNLGLDATGEMAQLSQMQLENWKNSIFGKGISTGIGTAEGFGMGTAFNKLSPTTFKTMMSQPSYAPAGG
ncbi:MAG TPA: hypothetical protein VFW94_24305 [Candidatus Acidoferrales bacterium]|nr:hypothetical protein [Candidatus Acidoferrales bacterium]